MQELRDGVQQYDYMFYCKVINLVKILDESWFFCSLNECAVRDGCIYNRLKSKLNIFKAKLNHVRKCAAFSETNNNNNNNDNNNNNNIIKFEDVRHS